MCPNSIIQHSALYSSEKKGVNIRDRVLNKAFFWTPSEDELKIIKNEWLNYRNQSNSGLVVEKVPINSNWFKNNCTPMVRHKAEDDYSVIQLISVFIIKTHTIFGIRFLQN